MKIFFSHSSRDKALLRELRDCLPPWLTAWIDEDELRFGEDLEVSLKGAIDDQTDYLVLFVGHEAFASPWVRREVEWALQREKALGRVLVLPVLLVDVRERLEEIGLAGRITLEVTDFSRAGTKLLAEKLINHLGAWLSASVTAGRGGGTNARPAQALDETLLSALQAVPAEWRHEVDALLTLPFLESVTTSRIGRIPLTAEQYYQRILGEMGRAGENWRIIAVSTLTSMLWSEDSEQSMYAARNLAAAARGSVISRLFLVPVGAEPNFRATIEVQEAAGINVRVGSNRLLAHVPQLEGLRNVRGARR